MYLVSSQWNSGRTRCSLPGLILNRTHSRPKVPLLVNQALSEAEVSHLQPCSFHTFEPPRTAFGSTNAFGQQPQQPATNPMFGNLGTNNTGTSAFSSFASPHTLCVSGVDTTSNRQVHSDKITPPLAILLSALLNQPLDLGRSVEVPLRSVGVGMHLGGLLPPEHQGLMFLDPPPRVQGALLVVVVRFLGSQSLQRPSVPLLQVRRIIFMRLYHALRPPVASADPNPPPVTTGTSTPTYSVFSEKDPSNPTTILQYQTITATPTYRGTSLEVSQRNLYFSSMRPAVVERCELGITLARLPTKSQDSRRIWPNIVWNS